MKTRFLESARTCNICFEGISVQGNINSCVHEFCFACIKKWAQRQNTCPLCIRRFSKIKKTYKRTMYVSKPSIELNIHSNDQRCLHLPLADYLVSLGWVQGTDFIIIQRPISS